MYDLTAAHPSLPLGTWVKVTNLAESQGRSWSALMIVVPSVPGRIIDLSYSAAQVLHFKDQGVQKVRLDVVHPQMIAALTPLEH